MRGQHKPKIIVTHDTTVGHSYTKMVAAGGGTLDTLSYADRCEMFFDDLYTDNPAWRTEDFRSSTYHHQIFETKDMYIRDRLNDYKNTLPNEMSDDEKNKDIDKNGMRKVYELKYQKILEDTKQTELHILDAAVSLRVFTGCYLDSYGPLNSRRSDDGCSEVENRLFQWISRLMPEYTRWDGQVMNHMPRMDDFIKHGKSSYKPLTSECFLKDMKNGLNGKGIVVSAADGHVDQLLSLFALLRATKMELPVQIVHSGDLSPYSQEELIHAARTTKLHLSKVENIEIMLQWKGLSEDYTKLSEEEMLSMFPQIELWFVDVSRSVAQRYRGHFSGYANKLLAYFFSSFQHTMLMDTDTVPMTNLDENILQTDIYKKFGAYFFRDRELQESKAKSDAQFFAKLMPSVTDELLFNVPKTTNKTLKNRYIDKYYTHYMESGVVAIDKRRHFGGVLGTVQLNLWSPVMAKIWGDKELFWLGMSMMGDEEYYMNGWAAGTAGQITPKKFRLSGDKTPQRRVRLKGNQLCSTHPAHISSVDNSTLLWVNSGVSYCKHPHTYKNDFDGGLFRLMFDTPNQLKEMYTSYLRVEAAIVPAAQEIQVDMNNGENIKGWESLGECSGYMYCAYDLVAGLDNPETNGLLVEFDLVQRTKNNFISSAGHFYNDLFGLKNFRDFAHDERQRLDKDNERKKQQEQELAEKKKKLKESEGEAATDPIEQEAKPAKRPAKDYWGS